MKEEAMLGEPVEPIIFTKEKKEKKGKNKKKDNDKKKKKEKKKPGEVVTRDLDQSKFNPVSNPDFITSKQEKWTISTTRKLPAIIEKKLNTSSPITPTERQGFMVAKYFPTEGYTHLDPSKSDNVYSAFNQLQKKTARLQHQRPTHLRDGIKVLMYARASWSYHAQISTELTFRANDTFAVIKQQADGWWYAELIDNERTARGLIPGNYMIPL